MMHTLIDLQVVCNEIIFRRRVGKWAEYLQASKCKRSVIDLIIHQTTF